MNDVAKSKVEHDEGNNDWSLDAIANPNNKNE